MNVTTFPNFPALMPIVQNRHFGENRIMIGETPITNLTQVFDRFYRVRNNRHDEIEGNGLGLSIVKSIVEQHGGGVSVESEPGKGSRFTMTLTLIQQEALVTLNS